MANADFTTSDITSTFTANNSNYSTGTYSTSLIDISGNLTLEITGINGTAKYEKDTSSGEYYFKETMNK